ncbi:unnamed protein product [Porites lobata]|uniref:Uncharacterized protein n=1 Tax=Porites lobata TaxID=104759 RepID=A0ABN8QZE7_9CNID|nr:unnamed protein product [Porites lobata]
MFMFQLMTAKRDQKQNTWICQETGVSDIINTIREAKRRCAGHIAWLFDNHWTIRATDCGPKRLDQKTGSSKNKMERQSHQTADRTLTAKISQAQTPVGSIQGGVDEDAASKTLQDLYSTVYENSD